MNIVTSNSRSNEENAIAANRAKHSGRKSEFQQKLHQTRPDNAVRDRWFAEYDSDSPGTAMLVEQQLINFDRQVRFSTNAVIDTEIALHQAENASERDEALLESLHKDLKNKLRYQNAA